VSRPQALPVRGFTLIELLVVIAIMGILVGLVAPSLASARRSARGTQASAASRTLMQAYMMYATEHRGHILPGYLPAIMNGRPIEILDEWGQSFQGPLAERWVYRLAPYFDFKWAGTTHVNKRAELLGRQQEILAEGGASLWAYHISVFPSFGINYRFVGGNYANDAELRKNHHIRRIDQPTRPDHLIAFASSRFWNAQPGQPLGEMVDGFHRVEPPPLGATYRETDSPPMFGCVHPRFEGKVLSSFLDGHAGLLTKQQVVDRTYWSDPAARTGNANWEP
jgi:prepilin-type N-terminal cleavage/methylation domain-containing protein